MNYPVTLIWPKDAQWAAIGGQWRRVDGHVEATYTCHEELEWGLAFKDLDLSLEGPGGAPKERPVKSCRHCGGTEWWERPAERGGGWLCARCHPAPPGLTIYVRNSIEEKKG